MTFREKLTQEHPELVSEECLGGCSGCPFHHGYESPQTQPPPWSCCSPLPGETAYQRCARCWDREMPNSRGERYDL